MMRRLLVSSILLLTASACSHTSFYSQSGAAAAPIPVTAVKVVRARQDLVTPWREVGRYRGSASTVDQAVHSGQQRCAQSGAEFFIFNTDPYLSGRRYRVDGICAVNMATPTRVPAG